MREPTERFSDRVEDYVRYRPSYPEAVVEELRAECGLDGAIVADIGSGPGNLSRLLLPYAGFIYGVEPNTGMRSAGELALGKSAKFASVGGSAEETLLPDASVNLITAGQAYHWFRPVEAHREFARIIKPGGKAALVWNSRLTDETPFLRGYEKLLVDLAPEYSVSNHRDTPRQRMELLFSPEPMISKSFTYEQKFDWDGLKGRALSSSYVPTAGEANAAFLDGLRKLFETEQTDGTVSFLYESEVHYGTVGLSPS